MFCPKNRKHELVNSQASMRQIHIFEGENMND